MNEGKYSLRFISFVCNVIFLETVPSFNLFTDAQYQIKIEIIVEKLSF